MFGMGGSEILVILIVALLFLGPDKLPDAAKKISKGIRDIKKQSRVLQQTIEDDERIGGAIRDIKSALRGEEAPPARPRPLKPKQIAEATENTIAPPATPDAGAPEHAAEAPGEHVNGTNGALEAEPKITLPPTAGEADPEHPDTVDPAELASLVKPAAGAVPRTQSDKSAEPPTRSSAEGAAKVDDKPEPSHG